MGMMKEFFHGWRRKVGCLSLLLACLIAGAWMLCEMRRHNGVSFPLFNRQHVVYAVDGQIVWMGMPHGDVWLLSSEDYEAMAEFIMRIDGSWDKILEIQDLKKDTAIKMWAVPVWSVVLPLTFLSAYLIVWKPRKRANHCHHN
jgi:hypothetical protein